jgi:hypothetical protein
MSREIANYFIDSRLAVVYHQPMRIRKDRAAVSLARKRMVRMTPEERSEVARLGGKASGIVRRAKAARKPRARKAA